MTATPSLAELERDLDSLLKEGANVVAIHKEIPLPTNETAASIFLKVKRGVHSFIMENAEFKKDIRKPQFTNAVIGTEPFKILTTGSDSNITGDPLPHLEKELVHYRTSKAYELKPAILNGAAFGYIGYDCVRYFEPRVATHYAHLKDPLQLPESILLFCNSFVYLDYENKILQFVALCHISNQITSNYQIALNRLSQLESRLFGSPHKYTVHWPISSASPVSNMGQQGYETMVTKLKEHIVDGDIIQIVASQRVSRPLRVHPFDVFQTLREVNPSRYTFYIEMNEFELVGASPELLVKVQGNRVVNHPIAGTRPRGSSEEEDVQLESELLSDIKELSEHIMLVDLGRNDVNRVCDPRSTKVNDLMHIEKYSHVMHIVSEVVGDLRPECSAFDAFRSIFPAGTVSGAPKIKAMELIAQYEPEKRGVYAGAIGYFSFTGSIDTCIAIRTMVTKNGTAYLQAGGGFVYDSVPYTEYMESVNKMAGLARSIDATEAKIKYSGSDAVVAPIAVDANAINDVFASINKEREKESVPAQILAGKKILMIDNYDSFTWNLFEYLSQLGQQVIVYRNDQITVEECERLNPDYLVISPGPSWPKDAGISSDAIRAFMGKIPVLGVCLGHECMVEVFGAKIVHCGEVKHGKVSHITHDQKGVFENIPENIPVIRYHSLAADESSLQGTELIVTSRSESGIIMGVRHSKYTVEGVQFHPESIKTEYGLKMLENFLQFKGGMWN